MLEILLQPFNLNSEYISKFGTLLEPKLIFFIFIMHFALNDQYLNPKENKNKAGLDKLQ